MLGALQNRMLTPELVEHFVKTFEEEVSRRHKESGRTKARLESQMAEVQRKLEGVLRAIENGAWNVSLKQRLDALEAEKQQLHDQLAAKTEPDTKVRIPIDVGHLFRCDVGHHSDLKPVGIPISFRPRG